MAPSIGHRLRPPHYVLASVAASFAGLANGYDTGAIGALTTMSQFEDSIGKLSPSLLGFTVSLVQLAGAVPSVFAGYLADRSGRLRVILLGALLYVAGAVLQGTAFSIPQFLVGRACGGFGQGVFLSNVSVYICEIAPARHRGVLAGMPQFMATAGICVGYFTCYGTVDIQGSMAWRIPYLLQAVIGSMLALSCLVLPESPRWLLLHGRREQAMRSLKRLDFDMVEAERDFLATNEQQLSMSLYQSVAILFKRAYRPRTMLALFILGMVQLSGIDAVTYVRKLFRCQSPADRYSMPPYSSAKPGSKAPRRLSLLLESQRYSCSPSPFRLCSLRTNGVGAPRLSMAASFLPASCFSWASCTPRM